MDWRVEIRKIGRTYQLAVNGRWVEVERTDRHEFRVEYGSVATEADDLTRAGTERPG